jgi:hypothetical protein
MTKKPARPKRPREPGQPAKMVVDLATMDSDERAILLSQRVQAARNARLKAARQARRSTKGS